MSKCLNELTLEDVIKTSLQHAHNDFQEDYDHELESDFAPYGDTYVSSGNYVSEESEERAKEEWKDGFDIDNFVSEYLLESYDFREKVFELMRGVQ
jgi:alpha-amylase/alpha-mannosidase (GH57 family)